jgi:endonuclease YncB( thermonuclease family)
VKPQFKRHIWHWRVFSPMARPYFLYRGLAVGLVLAAALCPLQIAPGAERPERQYTRDPIRTYRPRTPTEFFNQDAVRFARVRIDTSGVIYADGHSLSLYGVALIPRNKICNPPDGVRWACGQRAFVALRNLLEGKSIACTFKHIAGPPKGCLLGGGRRRRASLAHSGLGGACGGGERGELC